MISKCIYVLKREIGYQSPCGLYVLHVAPSVYNLDHTLSSQQKLSTCLYNHLE